ncbi:MAG: hypothetical protein Q7R41_00655, partial [Phycisphaerales bacterium]|nr:hypothetical protein [Phycisphaerales bacterium]
MKCTQAQAVLLAVIAFTIGGCGSDTNGSTDAEAMAPAATPTTSTGVNKTPGERRTRNRRIAKHRAELATGAYSAARLLNSIKVAPES